MKITWVNHASFIFEYNGVKLITDPWMEGTAFDNGWALLSKTKLSFNDFSSITHIWFSHEHPDHFSPPNINKIPKEYRANITVLFQKTIDGKVLNYCKKAGFGKIIEMEPDTYYKLAEDVQCLCNHFSYGDSYIYILAGKLGLLNVNDCIINSVKHAEAVKSKIKQVDVLFTQFGYANKVGDTADVAMRQKASDEKLKRIGYQNEVFKPEIIVPFASYVYFCHEENTYMNQGFNKVDVIYNYITNNLKTKCVVLYPGEEWEIGSNHASEASIAKYEADYKKAFSANPDIFIHSEKMDENVVMEESKKFASTIKKANKSFLLNFLSPTKIYVDDYKKSFLFSLSNGLQPMSIDEKNCDISLNSEALFYCFKNMWGGDTLQINARFQVPHDGIYHRFRTFFRLAGYNNQGTRMNNTELFECIMLTVKQKVKRLLPIARKPDI